MHARRLYIICIHTHIQKTIRQCVRVFECEFVCVCVCVCVNMHIYTHTENYSSVC